MDIDDSFTRELEESSLMTFDAPAGGQEDILDLDLENKDKTEGEPQQPANRFVSSVADAEAREAALRAELESVRRVNKLIASVTKSIQDATENMSTVNQAVNNANFLLDKYSQILSQSTHTSRIILNGHWQGSTNDVAEMEQEAQMAVIEAERRKREEEEAAAAREREARAREAAAAAAATRAAGDKRGRATGRKTPGSRSASAGSGVYGSSGYNSQGTTSGTSSRGTTRGILRGSGLARYAGRGTPGVGRGGAAGRGARGS
ncbi:hypothetical protein ABW19_dt0202238 [Dactylella cylindrospora]|nr:hypothetical protein ABW19_dt0202238 [Dactylella cylindrospora]